MHMDTSRGYATQEPRGCEFYLWHKSWMRGQVFWSFHLKPQHFRRLEDVLLTTSIALDENRFHDRKSLESIGFSKRDLVTNHHILALVHLCVSADDDPEIGGTRPRISGAHFVTHPKCGHRTPFRKRDQEILIRPFCDAFRSWQAWLWIAVLAALADESCGRAQRKPRVETARCECRTPVRIPNMLFCPRLSIQGVAEVFGEPLPREG